MNMSSDIINQFVYRVTPTSDSTYDWYLNLSGTAKARAAFTAEGRKKNCVIKLEEIEKISSLHTHPTANNQQHINNPLVFTLLHRLLSRANSHSCSAPVLQEPGPFYLFHMQSLDLALE